MGRWKPEARARLQAAALDLYAERGFEETTVAEIAGRAGLAERTFFRHFSDKREVLFGDAPVFAGFLVDRIADAPATVAPIDAIAAAFEAVGAEFESRRDLVRQRQRVVDAHRDLRERELIKLATLASTLAEALRRRGAADLAAALAAETGVAVFKIAFARWISSGDSADLPSIMRSAFADLKAVASGR